MAKKVSPFTGRWRIVSMSMWDEDYLDEEVEAFIEFKGDALAVSSLVTSAGKPIAA